MTVNDKTYFESEPSNKNNAYEPYRWRNTFHFLRLNNNYYCRHNYTLTEIQNRLEHENNNQLPVATAHGCQETTTPVEDGADPREDRIVGTNELVRV